MWVRFWFVVTTRLSDLGSKKWDLRFNTCYKNLAVLFDLSINSSTINIKMDGHVLDKKTYFIVLGLSFLLKLDWVFPLPLLLKRPLRKLGPWLLLWSLSPLQLCFFCFNSSSGLAWNNDVMNELVLPTVAWKCWINSRKKFVGLFVLYLLKACQDFASLSVLKVNLWKIFFRGVSIGSVLLIIQMG